MSRKHRREWGWGGKRVWKCGGSRLPAWARTLNRPAHSESLYRLSYADHSVEYYRVSIYLFQCQFTAISPYYTVPQKCYGTTFITARPPILFTCRLFCYSSLFLSVHKHTHTHTHTHNILWTFLTFM